MEHSNRAGSLDEGRSNMEKAKEKGQEMASEAKHKVEEVAHKAEQKVSDVAEKAGHMATEAVHKAEQAAASRVREQKDRVATGIHTVADALRRGSERLPENEREFSPIVHGLADGIDRVSSYLERKDVQELSMEVERFARQNTAAFLGGAFALGFLGARFMKASADEAREPRMPAPMEYSGHGRLPSHMEQGTYVPPSQSELPGEPGLGTGRRDYA